MIDDHLTLTRVACAVGIYSNFQWQKSLKNQYLPHSESKSY
jgi:hypothetical protein